MQQMPSWKKIPLLILASGLVLSVAFAQSNSGKQPYVASDTIPAKQKKIRDLDEALAEIDQGELELQMALREIESHKLEAEVRKALKNIEIDMPKMKEDIARALKDIDMNKINADVAQALAAESEMLKAEVRSSLAKVDMEKIKADLEKLKEVDLDKIKIQLEGIQPQVEKAMKEAGESMEKARKEISFYKRFVDALDKDGLLNKNGNYTIDYKNRELTINGQKLPADATQKYADYLRDKEHFRLEKKEDGLDINN